MSIKRIRHETDPANQVDYIVLEDHFGKQHHVVVHPFIVKDKPGAPGEYDVVQMDIDAVVGQETKLMELRERHFFQHMLKHHPQHPKTLSHPDHPERRQQAIHGTPGPSVGNRQEQRATGQTADSLPTAQAPETGDCGCGGT